VERSIGPRIDVEQEVGSPSSTMDPI
jgi:hypothetical protein